MRIGRVVQFNLHAARVNGIPIICGKHALGIRFGAQDKFSLITGVNSGYKYVITLDEDSYIVSADELTREIAHSYNDCAVISLKSRTRVASANKTLYAKLFSYAVGRDLYSSHALSESRDVFCKGNFTGKGIYKVEKFYTATYNAFPDNRILSHDFVEGEFASSMDSDIEVLESAPESYSQFLSRQLRWLRGDCQLLPYLWGKV